MSERGTCVEDLKFELPAKRTAVNVKVFPAGAAVCMALSDPPPCRLRIWDYPELHGPLHALSDFLSLHAFKDCAWHTSDRCQSDLFTGIGSKNK